jgi:hypothetical protein
VDLAEKVQRRFVMFRWIALLLASSLSAQVAPAPKYKVVKAGKPEPTVAALNALADQGYRLLVPGPLFILRREATPPDTYRYLAMSSKGGPVQTINWVNEQGARGYRWLPEAGVMEKEPHPRNYEYASAILFGWRPKKAPTASDLIGQGYRPLGTTAFESIIGPPETEFLFEQELGERPKPVGSTGWEVETADAMRAGNVWKQADALAKQGYRYLAPYVSRKGGGQAVLMQKCGTGEGPFEYRYFDVHNLDQLVKELNEQGKDSFHVLPMALRRPPHLLEHLTGSKETYAYHVLQEKDPAALEQILNAPEQEGYVPIGYVWRVGWTADVFLLLEKSSTASAVP